MQRMKSNTDRMQEETSRNSLGCWRANIGKNNVNVDGIEGRPFARVEMLKISLNDGDGDGPCCSFWEICSLSQIQAGSSTCKSLVPHLMYHHSKTKKWQDWSLSPLPQPSWELTRLLWRLQKTSNFWLSPSLSWWSLLESIRMHCSYIVAYQHNPQSYHAQHFFESPVLPLPQVV